MASDREAGFVAIEDILSPPTLPTITPHNDRIARLQEEIKELSEQNDYLFNTNERCRDMLRTQQLLNDDLGSEVTRHKDSVERLQERYNAGIERINEQEGEIRDYRVEIDHLQKCVDELQPVVDKLRGYDLELKTYRVAMRVFYNLLMEAGAHTPMHEILARYKQQVLDIDAGNGIRHDEGAFNPEDPGRAHGRQRSAQRLLTVADYVDDIASEASEVETTPSDDDSIHDFVVEDTFETPSRTRKRKRKEEVRVKQEEEEEEPVPATVPETPTRTRASAPFSMGADPVTPPSSQRKKLPRKAKNTVDGTGFYNLRRLSYPEGSGTIRCRRAK